MTVDPAGSSSPDSQPQTAADEQRELDHAVQLAARAALEKYLLPFAVSAPVVTAAFFIFGRRFSRMFYAELGIEDSVLELSVQDYVIRSEGAAVQVFGRNLWFILGATALIGVTLSIARRYPRSLLMPLASAAVAATGYAWPLVHDYRTTALIVWTAIATFAVLAVRAAISVFAKELPVLGAAPRAFVALLIALLFAFATTSAATLEGRRLACVYDNQRTLARPISLISEQPLGLKTDQPGEHGKFRSESLRLISRTPAGLVVFYDWRSPRSQTLLIPDDDSLIIEFEKSDPLIIDPGKDCRGILGSGLAIAAE